MVLLSDIVKNVIESLITNGYSIEDFEKAFKFGIRAPALLSERQKQVLILIAKGKTVKDIATELNLGVKTVESHKFQVYKRLGIHNVAQAVHYAFGHKLIELTEPKRFEPESNQPKGLDVDRRLQ